ncbi:MAG: hypothetical protein KJO03_09915, partial [Gammaproteobacteria bacterium]|nr:hypothetical protein [Gammaproteobacteria bacterium]
ALKVITIESEFLIVEVSTGAAVAVGADGSGTPHELTPASIITERKPKNRIPTFLIKTSLM